MNEIYRWVSQQHHGLRTFKNFQQKLESLSRDEPEQAGLYRLLSNLVGGYVEAFDGSRCRWRLQTTFIVACWSCWQVSIYERTRIAALPTSIALRHLICCIDAEVSGADPQIAFHIGCHRRADNSHSLALIPCGRGDRIRVCSFGAVHESAIGP